MTNQLLKVLNKKLYISTVESVHPNLLLRMPLFSPRKSKKIVERDATEDFKDLTIVKNEGYDKVCITGQTLNVQVDFKVWCGVLLSFYKHGYDKTTIKLKFSDFAKFCGYPAKKLDASLRKTIESSLGRLANQTIQFKTTDAKKTRFTSLILKGYFDSDVDEISLTADPDLWELYAIDHQILVNLNVLKKLPRSETAQCLYLFLASLPKSPIPVTLTRMRERIKLSMSDKECNRSIRKAIAQLEKIGYLSGAWITWQDETAYQIAKRNKLMLTTDLLL